jgi:hypothetical protein
MVRFWISFHQELSEQKMSFGFPFVRLPGPAKEGELSVFHLSTRCMRHKLDYIESISNEADIICLIIMFSDF